jgi:NAD(P)-dependent dehydrogenase (short-subunit alcohol dehydrogenase family)
VNDDKAHLLLPWMQALTEAQRQAAEAQAEFHQQLTQLQAAFLRSSIAVRSGLAVGSASELRAPVQQTAALQPLVKQPLEVLQSVPQAPPLSRARPAPVAAAASGFTLHGLLQAKDVVVCGEGDRLADALVTQLVSHGIPARSADSAEGADAVIVLAPAARDAKAATRLHQRALGLARTLARTTGDRGGCFVTVQDLGGDFGLSGADLEGAWCAGLTGLVKTLALEWPQAEMKAIDLPRAGRSETELALAIVLELLLGAGDLEVMLPVSGRKRIETVPAVAAQSAEPAIDVAHGPVNWVVAGGARGVTPIAVEALARWMPVRVLLLGRSAPFEESAVTAGAADTAQVRRALLEQRKAAGAPMDLAAISAEADRIAANRELEASLAMLRQAGAEVHYASVDVRDTAAVERVVDGFAEQHGSIRGLVYAAGVIADKRVVDKTDEQFERVFTTKVEGFRNLLHATRGQPLAFISAFSSVAARTGNAGQSDYAMANEVLNRVCAAEATRRGGSCVVKSIGWGPWAGGMVTPALAKHFQSLGVPLIEPAAGARAFVEELRTHDGSAEVVLAAGELSAWSELQDRAAAAQSGREILAARSTYPELESHRVSNAVVIPAVLALNWFFGHMRRKQQSSILSCLDFQVLSGIPIEDFERGAKLKLAEEGQSLQLHDFTGRIRYRCKLGLGPAAQVGELAPAAFGDAEGFRIDRAEMYGKRLFHGVDFQVITRLLEFGERGCAAELVSTARGSWHEQDWALDAPLLDGGLQLARLFGMHLNGRPSLPTSFAAVWCRGGLSEGKVRCEVRARHMGAHKSVSDVIFFDSNSAPVAALYGVEMHFLAERPATAPALGVGE